MGFHKRWIREENLIEIFKASGIDGVKRYFKADAIFLTDDFSKKAYDLLIEDKLIELTNLLKKNANF